MKSLFKSGGELLNCRFRSVKEARSVLVHKEAQLSSQFVHYQLQTKRLFVHRVGPEFVLKIGMERN